MGISIWGAVLRPLRIAACKRFEGDIAPLLTAARWLQDEAVLAHLDALGDDDPEGGGDLVLEHLVESRLLLQQAEAELLDPELQDELARVDSAYAGRGHLAHLLSEEAWEEMHLQDPLPGFLAGWPALRREAAAQVVQVHHLLVEQIFPPGFSLEGDDCPPTKR